MRIEESIIINRRPEEAFACFDDRRNDSRWMDTVVSSAWIDDAQQTALGRRGRMVMHTPRLTEFDDEVIDYEPDRRVSHRSVSDSMVIRTACHADPAPEGTRATLVFEPERLPGGPIVSRLRHRSWRAPSGATTGATSAGSSSSWKPPPEQDRERPRDALGSDMVLGLP
jgi:hypothetical protein